MVAGCARFWSLRSHPHRLRIAAGKVAGIVVGKLAGQIVGVRIGKCVDIADDTGKTVFLLRDAETTRTCPAFLGDDAPVLGSDYR